jgi:uncharacterized membrane protein
MNVLFLVARALHVVCAALWLGGVTVLTFYVAPAAENMGPDGGKLFGAMERGGIHIFMQAVAGLTVLLGLYLYWHFTAGFDSTISGSTGGIFFGTGGVLGIIALIIGGSVVGRGARALGQMEPRLAAADPATRTKLMGEMESLRGRVRTFGRLVVVLVLVTTILMAVAHYV